MWASNTFCCLHPFSAELKRFSLSLQSSMIWLNASFALVHNLPGSCVLWPRLICAFNCKDAAKLIDKYVSHSQFWASCRDGSGSKEPVSYHVQNTCSARSAVWIKCCGRGRPTVGKNSWPGIDKLMASSTTAKTGSKNNRYLLSTFNICDQILFTAMHALTNHHHGIFSHIFESQIFLYIKQNFWGIENIILFAMTMVRPKHGKKRRT